MVWHHRGAVLLLCYPIQYIWLNSLIAQKNEACSGFTDRAHLLHWTPLISLLALSPPLPTALTISSLVINLFSLILFFCDVSISPAGSIWPDGVVPLWAQCWVMCQLVIPEPTWGPSLQGGGYSNRLMGWILKNKEYPYLLHGCEPLQDADASSAEEEPEVGCLLSAVSFTSL